MVRLSVLDLAPITQGSDAAAALRNTLDLARHAERLGFHRYWLAEHHNMPGIASAATSVVIGHVAAGTRTIRVGAGGIMLPNHAPAGDRRAVRHARVALPGTHRFGAGAGARHRSRDRARVETHARERPRCVPAGRPRADGIFRGGTAGHASRPSPAPDCACRSTSSARARSARGSPRRSGCRSRSRRTSRRAHDAGASDLPRPPSARRRNWRSPTRFSASTSSPPRPTRRRVCWRRLDESRSRISAGNADDAAAAESSVREGGRAVRPAPPLEEVHVDRDGGVGVHGAGRLPALHRADRAR